MRTWTLVIAFAVLGCTDKYPDPKPNRPTAPDVNDPAFAIQGLRSWYLIGDAATHGDDQLVAIVTAPSGTKFVDAYVADLPPIRLSEQSGGFAMQVPLAAVAPGDQDIVFSADGADLGFAKVGFHRSAAYYVLVSTDYDFSDPSTYATTYMDWLHRDHPTMRITHFWAPYTYTDPAVTVARRGELDTWIHQQRDTFHDEIGLHIHPYCTFVVDAGMTCITDQSTVYPAGDLSGYTINVSSYGRDNFGILLRHAADIFAQHDLGKPSTFRAGGWTADLNTLFALNDNGYIADTSALNWKYIQQAWKGTVLASWNKLHWAPITDTSQPYWPSQTDVLTDQPGANLGLLELPDNGVMIDYVTLAEINAIFDANWDGHAFATPRTLMMGFHPSDRFSQVEYKRVDDFLTYADQHLATRDKGPVVYITLHDVTPAFPAP